MAAAACGAAPKPEEVVRFWGLGREGEVVDELLDPFRAEHPELRVEVQQIPFTAAHEKLLTALIGGAAPDLAQVGNTWIPEFVVLGAVEPLDPWLERSSVIRREGYFGGVWETNLVDGRLYGVPWYVDTRIVFYRTDLLDAAGCLPFPRSWQDWLECMRRVVALPGGERFAILLPTDEWAQPVVLGLQQGATLLADDGSRGAFSSREFARAFDFYIQIFDEHLAPVLSTSQIGNVYQQFAEGRFAMYITGPWNLGEFRRRLPASTLEVWGTAPLPAPDENWPGVSLAGGASLVIFRSSERKSAAWQVVEYLSRPEVQLEFYRLSGDLPARVTPWSDPLLADDPQVAAFFTQLGHVRPMPRVAEWEQIATRLFERAEEAIQGAATNEQVLAGLDRDVDRFLAKRRWVRGRQGGP
ncbi:MAG: ABC transporter substrate-binding protein [Holophagae bacterium]|nr:MAG: ABC transporter substrate-binding protein [Holophagae bacterium]